MPTRTFWPKYAQLTPDPLFLDVERHILVCSVEAIPGNVPRGLSPRATSARRRRLAERAHRVTGGPTRHITMTAASVRAGGGDRGVEVDFETQDGIVDGYRSYQLLVEQRERWPSDQLIEFEILTGSGRPRAREIAGRLNTPLRAQDAATR